ncbi:hypothetical protein EW145_g2798 [Phellinidium pouzarii]|uniref:RNA polymerase II elongation factor ELL N-terminal domain-containing protein n=1 Tax=Phellinidium pouzarii TaxID=167371 RepID=A0A4S4L9P0_9AGAM|nr:hypothetical protein EW145_g2798 [Phellinidium pouzarii]
MPLPANSSIPLQGHSRPGEGVPTKPKIAMIVRLTEETLDALQSLSSADRMDFDFGDKSGIHIREQFFPMQYNKEKDNQELFIRTTMSARPNAALRLNANVVGKFLVERVFLDKALQKMRDTKAAADKQKSERKTIMIDTPPIIPTATQKSAAKRKAPPKNTSWTTPTIVKSYATTGPSIPTSEPRVSPSSTSFPKDVLAVFRQRLVHYLALGAATQPDIVKNVGGVEAERDVRLKITEILNEVAEQEQVGRKAASASASTKWLLKPRTWLEVRPYQYQDYTDNVRTTVARSARTWLKTLKISENEPAWDHVRFRNNGVASASNSAGAAPRAVNGTSTAAEKAKAKKNRGVKTKDVETKIKSEATVPPTRPPLPPAPVTLPRLNPPAESTIPAARIGKVKDKNKDTEKEEGELSAPETPPRAPAVPSNRRLPGSRSTGMATPTMMPPPPVPFSSQAPTPSQSSMAPPPKRTGPVDARSSKRPPPEQSERARAAPPIPPPAPIDRKPVLQVKKEVVKKEKTVPAAGAANGVGVGAAESSALSAKDREVIKRERERDRMPEEIVRSVKREKDRGSDRESVRGRERESDRERPREKEGDRTREKEHREREREKDRERAVRIRERERERESERAGEKGKERERPLANTAIKAGTKRKLAENSEDDSSDWGIEDRKYARKAVNANLMKARQERESMPAKASSSSLKVPRRESSPPRKIKRESPLPPSKSAPSVGHKVTHGSSSAPRPIKKEIKKEREREDSSRPVNAKQAKKRRSPTYTSSSEDDDSVKPKKAKAAPKPSAPAPRRPARPLPALSKHESLRSRYSSTYSEYLLAFQKLVAQKSKLTAMLRHGSVSASGESDGDTDMLSIEELEELSVRHQRLHDELESIKKNYMT